MADAQRASASWMEDVTDLAGLSARQCRRLAKARKEAGDFDALTLACFRRAARLGPADLLAYLTFRREMGIALSPAYLPFLERIRWALGPRSWLDAFHLVEESAGPGWDLPSRFAPLRGRFCAASSAFAAQCGERAEVRNSPFLSGMAAVFQRQEPRRAAFLDYLHGAGRICVVGNHAGMNGSRLGARIDAHDCVVRFNQFRAAHSLTDDVGGRADVWVRMPGVPRPSVDFSGGWVVLSGPDVRFRSSNWRAVWPVIEAGKPILTIPLEHWRALVGELAAPPSAGILFLAWLRRIRAAGLGGVSLAGFERRESATGAYHHAVPGKLPGVRHHWQEERRLLADWMSRDGGLWLEGG